MLVRSPIRTSYAPIVTKVHFGMESPHFSSSVKRDCTAVHIHLAKSAADINFIKNIKLYKKKKKSSLKR